MKNNQNLLPSISIIYKSTQWNSIIHWKYCRRKKYFYRIIFIFKFSLFVLISLVIWQQFQTMTIWNKEADDGNARRFSPSFFYPLLLFLSFRYYIYLLGKIESKLSFETHNHLLLAFIIPHFAILIIIWENL